jgi:GR25 family glycosyltransferase involved in LPS biosynthesis
MPSYCITLARRQDRWNRFIQQNEVEKLKIQKINGIDGKTLDILNDKRINPFTKRNILRHKRRSHEELDSVGGVGCALSHRAAWEKFLESGAPFGLIFEDDAVVPLGFFDELALVFENDPEVRSGEFDLLTFSGVKRFKNPTSSMKQGFSPLSSFALGHAYIVSKRAAQLFYDESLPISHHIDFYMPVQCMLHDLKMLGSSRYILRQVGARSDIQTRPSCPMCDVPTDYELNYSLIPHGEWYRAKASEYALLAILIAYIGYRTMKK